MQRQRDELVPIGDALADLDGPVTAIRAATPQALHHFTLSDQVNALVGASEADPDLGFMARMLVLCSLPRTNPGNRKEYKRVNGPLTLIMLSSSKTKLPTATCLVCCWPGCARRRYRPKAASWSWVLRSRSSCGSWAWLRSAVVAGANGPGSATR